MMCDRRSYEDGVLYVYDRWLFCTPIVPSTEVVGLMDYAHRCASPKGGLAASACQSQSFILR